LGIAHPHAAPLRRVPVALAVVFFLLVSTLTAPFATGNTAAAAERADRPVAAIVVGPVEGETSEYIREARRIATQLKSYGAIVREVHSPNATWSRVTAAARGASLLVYLGHGRGTPGPYGVFDSRTMNGLGLNRTSASSHRNVRHYGEYYLRASLRLAPGAVVILDRVPYAAGSSEPGRAYPARSTAVRRADNYAAGFLRAGAAAVFASDHSVASIVEDLFGAKRSMQSIFWRSPWTSSRYDSTFTSSRTSGARGILAPHRPGRYYHSVVGRLGWTTTDWQRTWGSTPASSSVRVASIAALLSALANNAVTEIVVADGTYRVSAAAGKDVASLWIGSRFAGRTNPVTVRAETIGGVTFDGGGATYFGGLSFEEGAHDQTWDGFVFANGTPTNTGVITFGGYQGLAAPHHITLRNITLPQSLTSTSPGSTDHGIYFSWAVGGPHDIVIDGLTVDGAGGLDSAIHFYHSDASNPNAWNVTIRNLRVTRTDQAIILWDPTLRDITVDTATVTDALRFAIRYESPGATGIVLANITSTGSGSGTGYYSSLGTAPAGLTFINDSFR